MNCPLKFYTVDSSNKDFCGDPSNEVFQKRTALRLCEIVLCWENFQKIYYENIVKYLKNS